MSLQETFIGALTLRTATYAALRERSDVFWRGFLVLFVSGIVVGAFTSLVPTIDSFGPRFTKEQVLEIANGSFERSFSGPPALRAQIQPYVSEIASMVYELRTLPPRAGAAARPLAAVLNYFGMVLATPFSWQWIGWTLFAGLLFQFSSRLLGGRASMAQMLGLTCLAAAPQIFAAVVGLLAVIAVLGSVSVLDGLGSLFGIILALWSAVVYIKATAVAQEMTLGRALGAIALGLVFLVGLCLAAVLLFGLVVGLIVGQIGGQLQ